MQNALNPANALPGTGAGPLLGDLPSNMHSMIVVFRWIDFLLHRVKRDRLLQLMNYYHEIGWIGEEARSRIMKIARGTLQDVGSYDLEEEEDPGIDPTDQGIVYRSMSEYRLSAADHIRSLMFIMRLKGEEFDGTEVADIEGELNSILGL
ncbi:hypothetical protein B6U90_00635 [Thermoplasmatales archaeon ex4484_6]|nr:MAG: hypothetical protein B6U90_00635 [Thermoplasmatales archaeon ex4484_6]